MVVYTISQTEARVSASLKQYAPLIRQTGRGQWSFGLSNGNSVSVSARLSDEWLLLEVPFEGGGRKRSMLDLVKLNGMLEGSSKCALMPNGGSTRLRADIPVDEGVEVTGRVNEACNGFRTALRAVKGNLRSSGSSEQPGGELRVPGIDLGSLVAESGWSFNKRDGGSLVVDLEATGMFHQAVVEHRGVGARVSVEIARAETTSDVSREALGLLLLTVCEGVRFARATVHEEGNSIVAFFEVMFGSYPTPVELRHALASLSVAARLCGREARAVQDDLVARSYMAVSGHGSPKRVRERLRDRRVLRSLVGRSYRGR